MATKTLAPALSWRQRSRIRKRLTQIMTHLILVVMGVAFALPFAYLISSSLKSRGQIFSVPIQWIPEPILWDNYPRALTYIPFFIYLKNTLYVATFGATGNLICCSLAAYGFSRIRWPGRDALFMVLIATMMLPTAVTIVPEFVLFSRIGWVGDLRPLTWPMLLGHGGAYLIFLLRQFYLTFPMELSDAAKIDGCSEFGIFWRILVPLSKPALVTVWLIEFIWHWNDFLRPLIYLKDESTYTLALGLFGFLTQRVDFVGQWPLLMAAATATTLPIIVLFLLGQRAFVQGISVTGIKG
jgi:multiple sugar transport system permease protein